jgi:hypothetical protein
LSPGNNRPPQCGQQLSLAWTADSSPDSPIGAAKNLVLFGMFRLPVMPDPLFDEAHHDSKIMPYYSTERSNFTIENRLSLVRCGNERLRTSAILEYHA